MTDTVLKIKPPYTENWFSGDLINDILSLIDNAIKEKQYGPYVLLFHENWKPFLYKKYIIPETRIESELFVEQRIKAISSIVGICYGTCCDSNTDEILDEWGIAIFNLVTKV